MTPMVSIKETPEAQNTVELRYPGWQPLETFLRLHVLTKPDHRTRPTTDPDIPFWKQALLSPDPDPADLFI